MGYINININYNAESLCEEISFVEPGKQSYTLGDTITVSDSRLSRDRKVIVKTVNYTENESGGLSTTVSGFSEEYKYTRKSPNCDISFFTMTGAESSTYLSENPDRDSKVYIKPGDIYGVGGWSMYSIIEKIVTEWIGLEIVNNLPNFWISDFTISIGSTFFEALVGLISEFEPIIMLDYGTLYILERNGAGALNSGQIILSGSPNRTVDREYTPTPGCIRVEGGEGKYRAEKDPTASYGNFYMPHTNPEFISETVVKSIQLENGTYANYITDIKYHSDSQGNIWALAYNRECCTIISGIGHILSDIQTLTEIKYHESTLNFEYAQPVILSETVTCNASVALRGAILWLVYNKISNRYEHDEDWNLERQISTKKELFVYDSEEFTYVKYDPRDIRSTDELTSADLELITSEIRSTKYTCINAETYSVDTLIATQVYNEEDEEWQTFYTFEKDIVEAGGQQRISGINNGDGNVGGKTMQVFAGNCPETPVLSVTEEPARIFNIPTSDWDEIEDCYVYLSALVAYEFQHIGVNTPLIDPLPLMSIGGLGSIIQSGIVGNNYVKGYTINIDANSGYSTDLELEARRV